MALDPRLAEGIENDKVLKQFPPYGSIDGSSASDTCPTCRGTGRIPRGHENQLVAVIPCNDVRLKPRRTKLYVFISMVICLLICCLILFFLFPRSVSITPVSVLSVTVYFTPDSVDMEVKNLLNITNDNFVPVQIRDFNMQGLVAKTVMGKTKMTNLTAIKSRSKQGHKKQLSEMKTSYPCLFWVIFPLRLTMNISYFSHTEQLSLDTFEYIDCGTNSTTPHPVR
uniref:Transmembrane protein 106A n=1 Tax=Nothobranchius furzeri TaxID=105023 RepID=A0A8C6P532_NOTFU